MVNHKKKSLVDSLVQSLGDNNNLVLVKIDRTSHQNLENLRKELKKVDSCIKVIKNSFFEKAVSRLAIKNEIFAKLKEKFFPLKEASALIIIKGAWDKTLKAFEEFTKKDTTLSYKLALLDSIVYGQSETQKIAKLPSREQLIAKIVGSMKAPVNNFVYAMKYNTNKFVYVLKAKSEKK